MKAMVFLQLIALAILSPLVSGIITVAKNRLRMRRGQSVLQPYFNLMKFSGKSEVISSTASWIFGITPYVVFASSLAALSLVLFSFSGSNPFGDCLALIFVLGLGRFFLALAALDTGSSFGGMGSSREMFVSSLAEPAVCLAFFTIALKTKSTFIGQMGLAGGHLSQLGACAALFLVSLAETSRVPVDNQETHLELTMIHEAMVLEYSGRRLAVLEAASYLKQMVWLCLIGYLLFPAFPPAMFTAGIAALAALTAVIEVTVAKMRLFRVVDYFGFAFALGLLAAAGALFGV